MPPPTERGLDPTGIQQAGGVFGIALVVARDSEDAHRVRQMDRDAGSRVSLDGRLLAAVVVVHMASFA
jgi:hypothetical protein